jgi:hypothetical protein
MGQSDSRLTLDRHFLSLWRPSRLALAVSGNPFRLTDSDSSGDVPSASSPTYNGHLTGTWRVDQTAAGNSFVSFHELNPLGTWSIFFADLSGDNVSTLNGWSLEITAVPEPVNVALGCFAGVFLLVSLCRSQRVRKLLAH